MLEYRGKILIKRKEGEGTTGEATLKTVKSTFQIGIDKFGENQGYAILLSPLNNSSSPPLPLQFLFSGAGKIFGQKRSKVSVSLPQ